jgi:hypothetical protein
MTYFVGTQDPVGAPAFAGRLYRALPLQLAHQPPHLSPVVVSQLSYIGVGQALLAPFALLLQHAQHAGLGRLPVDAAVPLRMAGPRMLAMQMRSQRPVSAASGPTTPYPAACRRDTGRNVQ